MADEKSHTDSGYTGPTNIRIVDGRLHIDGYPNASKLVELDKPIANRLAGLRRHQSVLAWCEKTMQKFGEIFDTQPELAEATFIGIITQFCSCFADDVPCKLDPSKTFKGKPYAKESFEFIKAIRDKHYVHDQSELTSNKSTLVLRQNGDVEDILSIRHKIEIWSDRPHAQLLYDLITLTLEVVTHEIDQILPRAFAEVAKMTAEERIGLPEANWTTPRPANVTKKRKA